MKLEEPISRTIFLSLGSNIGSRIDNLSKTINLLIESGVIFKPLLSSFYQSEPYGYLNQDFFINIAIKAETNYNLMELLYLIKSTEYLIGRIKRDRWHEREIDIDIIFYDNLIYENKYISIPHKEFRLRHFVLVPLAEIAPEYLDPQTHKSMKQLLEECEDKSVVRRIK